MTLKLEIKKGSSIVFSEGWHQQGRTGADPDSSVTFPAK